jgi:hypothetical protein
MGFLFTSKKKEKMIAIFDIGSGSVGGAMVRIPTDGNALPSIIKSVRNEIRFHENFDFNSFLKDMIFTLNLTSNSLFYKNVGSPDEIICILASPWYLSETRAIKMNRDSSFSFTKRLAEELINKEILNLTKLYKDKYGTNDSTPQVIEQHTMAVLLDDSSVIDPLGKKCKSLEMDMVVSLAPKLCTDQIKEILSKTFHNDNVSFSTFTVDTYLAMRDKYISPNSYLLVDVSGEITDIGVVTDGVLRSVLSFPFGKKTFFKHICTKLRMEIRDAREIFKLYREGHLSSVLSSRVAPVFKEIETLWDISFSQCLETLPSNILLPSTIFLTTDNDMKSWFTEILKKKEHIQSNISLRKYNVITLDGPEFLNMCDINEGGCDPFLMIEAISAMRKINR